MTDAQRGCHDGCHDRDACLPPRDVSGESEAYRVAYAAAYGDPAHPCGN